MAGSPPRRLAAIMFTDIAGFAALTQTDEARALELLERHNQLLRPLFPRFNGTEVKAIGDSFLVEFASALDATRCALEIQRLLRDQNATADDSWQILVRIGVHLGDVVHSDGDVFGDAVNIASRIEPQAEPGGICVSEPVFSQVRNKVDANFEPLPLTEMKNVRFPVAIYKVLGSPSASAGDLPVQGHRPRHRLAVLPFTNMSPDPNDEFFADGLTEDLITELARVPGCQVIARTSVMRYKTTPKGIKDVGRELAVDVALEGSVRKSKNRIRVTAQLIDAKTEAHLWAERFDRDFGEIFDLQSEIATRVASALKVELEPHHLAALERPATHNISAYEQYLRGRQFWWLGGESDFRTAILHFEKAIELDPTFALPYCGLADSYALLGNGGYVPLARALEKTESAARKALELDPSLADAHVSLAPVLYNHYDWAGAEGELRRAIELDPNSVLGHYWLAIAMAARGRLEGALAEARRGAELDPLSRQPALLPAAVLFYRRDYEGALAYLLDVEQRLGFRTDSLEAKCKLQLGRYEEAYELARKSASGSFEKSPSRLATLAIAAAKAGHREEAESILARLTRDARAGKCPSGPVALIYAASGDDDRAFEWFDKVYEERSALVAEDLMIEPFLDRLRKDPRFPALRRKFNF